MPSMKRGIVRIPLLAAAGAACLLGASATAAPKQLQPSSKVTATQGLLSQAFALDENGSKLAFIQFTPKGQVQIVIGPPGGKQQIGDISSFTATPEKILGLSGYWFVVSNQGQRRAAIVDGAGKILHTTEAFDDCGLSYSPKLFVTFSERREPGLTRRLSIRAYHPDGSAVMMKDVVIQADQTIVGSGGATFLGFTDSYLSAMVQKPGVYNRKADIREPPEFALYDVRTGKVGPGKLPPKLANFLDYVQKRSEKPGLPAVIVPADGKPGFELVGPGERVRPIQLTVPVADYDPTTLPQQQLGRRIVFSLLADRPGRGKGAKEEQERYALGFFSLDPDRARVSVIGEIALPGRRLDQWSAGGSRIAVEHATPDGNREILLYGR